MAAAGELCGREKRLTAAPLEARLPTLIAVPAQILDPRKAKLKALAIWHRHMNMMPSCGVGVTHRYAIVPNSSKW